MIKNRTFTILLSIILLLITAEIGLVWLIRNHYVGSMDRYQIVDLDNFRLKSTNTVYGYDRQYIDKFLSLIKDSITNSVENFTIEEAIKIREYILNQGAIKGERITGDPLELFKGLNSGKTLLCGELAHLYGFLLNSLGFTVRHIGISRSVFDEWDNHAIVEIYDEKRKKWILTDPTFNVSFKHKGNYLSSDELYDLIHSGDFASIKIVHGEKTKYEYSLEEYYISYFSLFDNLFYSSHVHLPGLYKYPPFRWFDDRRINRLVLTDKHPVRGNEINIQNAIMFFVIVVNPLTIFALLIGLLIIIQIKLRANIKGQSHLTIRST